MSRLLLLGRVRFDDRAAGVTNEPTDNPSDRLVGTTTAPACTGRQLKGRRCRPRTDWRAGLAFEVLCQGLCMKLSQDGSLSQGS